MKCALKEILVQVSLLFNDMKYEKAQKVSNDKLIQILGSLSLNGLIQF